MSEDMALFLKLYQLVDNIIVWLLLDANKLQKTTLVNSYLQVLNLWVNVRTYIV
jgi:hypothetical protein